MIHTPPEASTQSHAPHPWRTDITGLRALAVLPVLIYHAFPSVLPGGFFGVDIFFVISGYLISGIIFRGLMRGSFSWRDFYAKRVRRILPNLILLLVFVAAVGWFLLATDEYENLGRHIYKSAAFVQNFGLLKEVGYFTEDALRKPLLHLWSLAIEEQFYIVFPILCVALWRLTRSATALGTAVLLIFACSLEASLLVQNKSFAFYFPLTRFWELGAGILLAYAESCLAFSSARFSRKPRSALSCLGLIAIGAAMALYAPRWAHPGWITLAPVAGAVAIILARPDALVNRTLLAWRPMTFTGLISYSLYLWHWPLLAFLFIAVPSPTPLMNAAALALSLLLATGVYRFVENPMRRARSWRGVPVVAILLAGLIAVFALGEGLRLGHGLPHRPIPTMPDNINAIRSISEWDAIHSAPRIRYADLDLAVTLPSVTPRIAFIGDSHAAQYFSRAQALSNATGRSSLFLSEAAGAIDWTANRNAGEDPFDALLNDPQFNTLVFAYKWTEKLQNDQASHKTLAKVRAKLLEHPEKRAFVLLDYPWVEEPGRQGVTDPLRHWNRLAGSKIRAEDFVIDVPDGGWKVGNEAVMKDLAGVATFIDPTPFVCPNGRCDLLKWYKDDDHLQPSRLEKEGVWLDPVFRE